MPIRRTEPFSFLFLGMAKIILKKLKMILIKYILKENRNTDYYNVGKLWFGAHKITWSKWFFGNRICIVKMDKI